jgi:hypothetical protein
MSPAHLIRTPIEKSSWAPKAGPRAFAAMTFGPADPHSKVEARSRAISILRPALVATEAKRYRVLCTPGPWWRLERKLDLRINNDRIRDRSVGRPTFIACERDPVLFCVAASYMGPTRKRLRCDTQSDGIERVSKDGDKVLLRCDVRDLIRGYWPERRGGRFHAAILDLSQSIDANLLQALWLLPAMLQPPRVVLVTVLKGRERAPALKAIRTHGGRAALLAQALGAKVVDEFEYGEAAPMLQCMFRIP